MERTRGRWSLTALSIAVLCLLASQVVSGQRLPKAKPRPGWYFVLRSEGVTVHAKAHPSRGLPTFRGRGEVDGDLFEIAAVLADASRHPEWIVKCSEAAMLASSGPFDVVFYNRTAAPWPVADRDMVLKVHTTYDPARGTMVASFTNTTHPKRPALPGVVRMPNLTGSYHLQAVTQRRTMVTLTVDADPGGMIPEWLIKVVTRSYPLDVIRNLRKQVKRTRGSYDSRIARWRGQYGDYRSAR